MTQKLKERVSREVKQDLEQLNQKKLLVKHLKQQLSEAQVEMEKSRKAAESSLKKMKRIYDMEKNKESELKII